MIRGTPIADVLIKSDPTRALKITVVRGVRTYESAECNWAADQLILGVKRASENAQIADLFLPSFNIIEGASHDPDDNRYAPTDQFIAVLDQLRGADALIFATRECCGFADSNMVRLFERLSQYAAKVLDKGDHADLLKGKVSVVVAVGKNSAHSAASALATATARYGSSVCGAGILWWNSDIGNLQRNEYMAHYFERAARELVDVCSRGRDSHVG